MIGGESPRQQLAHDEVEVLDVTTATWCSLPPLAAMVTAAKAIHAQRTPECARPSL